MLFALIFKEKLDDNQERERRRSQVRVQKRLSSIPTFNNSSLGNDSISQEDANCHVELCIKLFSENVSFIKTIILPYFTSISKNKLKTVKEDKLLFLH